MICGQQSLRLLLGRPSILAPAWKTIRSNASWLSSAPASSDHGTKELIAIADGYRESALQSWREVLLDLKRRGLEIGPELVTGDGALGFWKALRQVYGADPRCSAAEVHKTSKTAGSRHLEQATQVHETRPRGTQDIWMIETRKDAADRVRLLLEAYGPKYEKATACLAKDRDALLSFYDFPADMRGSMCGRPDSPSRASSPRFAFAPIGPREWPAHARRRCAMT